MDIGQVIGVRVKGLKVDGVVVGHKYLRGSGGEEWRVALFHEVGRAYAVRIRRGVPTFPPSREYTAEEIDEATKREIRTRVAVEDRREEKRENRAEKLAKIEPKVGDEILVRYTSGPRWERVATVNEHTGKVGIEAKGYATKKTEANRRQEVAFMFGGESMARHVGSPRRYTWIDPRHIAEVRKAGASKE
jgi:hypothetical protein